MSVDVAVARSQLAYLLYGLVQHRAYDDYAQAQGRAPASTRSRLRTQTSHHLPSGCPAAIRRPGLGNDESGGVDFLSLMVRSTGVLRDNIAQLIRISRAWDDERTGHKGLQVAGDGHRLLSAQPDVACGLSACCDHLPLYRSHVRRGEGLGAREGRQPDAYVHHALSGELRAEPPGGSDLDGVRGGSLPRLSGGQPALLLGRDRAEVAPRARIHPLRFRFCLSVSRDGPLRDRLEDGDKELPAYVYRKAAYYLDVPGVSGSDGRAHGGRAFSGGHHGQHYSLRRLQAVRPRVQKVRRLLQGRVNSTCWPVLACIAG